MTVTKTHLAAVCLGLATLIWLDAQLPALAQVHNPFSVGISEGGGSTTGLSGWLLAKQTAFEQMLSGAVRAAKADGSALWMLSGLSFLYGVFHAAGPGHGKAVVASYMFANERALKRGVVISFMAAALQGVVAIAIVGVLALIFHATAQHMKDAARVVESLSYAGIAVLGAWLVWRKGGALRDAWRIQRVSSAQRPSHFAHAGGYNHRATGISRAQPEKSVLGVPTNASVHDHRGCGGRDHTHAEFRDRHSNEGEEKHVHGPDCGHFHAPDAATLGDQFSWTSALMTVFAAGLRPCSGAILVLVFALAQGIFIAGITATLAMSLGTAITTSGLASVAVLAGGLAVRVFGTNSQRGELILRGVEACAGMLILVLGLGLFLGVSGLTYGS